MTNTEINKLNKIIEEKENEISRLKNLLYKSGIKFESNEVLSSYEQNNNEFNQLFNSLIKGITKERLKSYIMLFRGRKQPFSSFYTDAKGKSGYAIACANRWERVCPKKQGIKMKCIECNCKKFQSLSEKRYMNHILDRKENDGISSIGIYPITDGNKCFFIVFDFDDHNDKGMDWKSEVNALRTICDLNDVPCLVEISKSGKGAHLWLFFSDGVDVKKARDFASSLLTKGATQVNQTSFKSYDRMIPMQDYLVNGSIGNLIFLPLHGASVKKGTSVFVDFNWVPYKNQWEVIENAKTIKIDFVNKKTEEWTNFIVMGQFGDDFDGSPSLLKKGDFHIDDFKNRVDIIKSNRLYIKKDGMKPRAQNTIRRLSAYSNKEFFVKQARGFSTKGIPRIVGCATDFDNYISIPRGCEKMLLEKLRDSEIEYKLINKQQRGKQIDVKFIGELRRNQIISLSEVRDSKIGIIANAAGSGKTVLGAAIISELKLNTLILVDKQHLMDSWIMELETFLVIDEPFSKEELKRNKRMLKSKIGKLKSNHNSMHGIIDVAMIKSLGKDDEINACVKEYGLVLVDECHHIAANTYYPVIDSINASCVYGLSATPSRQDNQDKKLFMQLGDVISRFTAREQAMEQKFNHYVFPRFTKVVNLTNDKISYNEVLHLISENEHRNELIVSDVEDCITKNRTPIVLTTLKAHANLLYSIFLNKADNVLLLHGGTSQRTLKNNQETLAKVPVNESLIIVATGAFIGEGFNYPRLDTLMLATPISSANNVEQYVGRISRDFNDKNDAIVYDYIDSHLKVMEAMYHKRIRTYKKVGYSIINSINEYKVNQSIIHDAFSYISYYEEDLLTANSEIIISSNIISKKRVHQLLNTFDALLRRGVRIIIIVGNKLRDVEVLEILTNMGIHLVCTKQIEEKYTTVDKKIVWYGDCDHLNDKKMKQNVMIRLIDTKFATELEELTNSIVSDM